MAYVKRFKNGNINIRFDKYDLGLIEAGEASPIVIFLNALDEVDTYLCGDEFCLSYWSMAIFLYSFYSDRLFLVDYSDLQILKAGKTLKLKAIVPNKDQAKAIEKYFSN